MPQLKPPPTLEQVRLEAAVSVLIFDKIISLMPDDLTPDDVMGICEALAINVIKEVQK